MPLSASLRILNAVRPTPQTDAATAPRSVSLAEGRPGSPHSLPQEVFRTPVITSPAPATRPRPGSRSWLARSGRPDRGDFARPAGASSAQRSARQPFVYDDIETAADLPAGWHDEQAAGRYRLDRGSDNRAFGYTVAPTSWKRFTFPPNLTIATAQRTHSFGFEPPCPSSRQWHSSGVRACEIAALGSRIAYSSAANSQTKTSELDDPPPSSSRSSARLVEHVLLHNRWGRGLKSAAATTSPDRDPGRLLSSSRVPPKARRSWPSCRRGGRVTPKPAPRSTPSRRSEPRWANRCRWTASATASSGNSTTRAGRRLRTAASNAATAPVLPDLLLHVGRREIRHGRQVQRHRAGNGTRASMWRSRKWRGRLSSPAARSLPPVADAQVLDVVGSIRELRCVGCGRCIAWCPVRIDVREELAAIAPPVSAAARPLAVEPVAASPAATRSPAWRRSGQRPTTRTPSRLPTSIRPSSPGGRDSS